MLHSAAGKTRTLNREAPWDRFDSRSYLDHNYRTLREDDRQIIAAVRDHFAACFPGGRPAGLKGIDVGAGANLYPALSMLPWCDEILLYERAQTNVTWLRGQIAEYGAGWDQFWSVLSADAGYQAVGDPRACFRERAEVRQGDLFDLAEERGGAAAERWDIGTMFFVAESMSTVRHEFEEAVAKFLGCLNPGAPFAAAFMENSSGYEVAGQKFPAYPVDRNQVGESLVKYVDPTATTIIEIPIPGRRLRTGYTGMLLACGRSASNS
ncbi:SCO2525 family SAM-dependent methyltransferase [Yinghuangia soli]|uniref:SCO2525 family SAM-dependent methyltransferase n=1 Tax=Yinghuangia soli TaxID=2908204 RepID=A0AA41PYX5_9ACTN|nr:SCO2525 family SAM-dependent methyltransferase [Yinghuangia soli]MCF2528484.1 SCO2525 family SAM-dependent methyltransferase [Yinghuangia soli]